jgi:hypothetical protein
MDRRLFTVAFCALALVAGCSKPTHETIMKDSIAKMKEMTTVLHNVTDEDSAKAAADKLKTIEEAMKKLKTDEEALPKLSADDEKKLMADHETEMKDVENGLMGEMMRIGMNPKLSAPIQEVMKNFSNDMSQK